MTRLTADALPALAARGIPVPTYDRSALRPGLLHIGVGAFHRCHQSDYLEDLLQRGLENRFITGVTLRAPYVADALTPQGGLYTRSLVQGETRDLRVIGAHRAQVDARAGNDGILETLTRADMTVATLTVTEKGYCHVPSTGALDDRHADILHDLAHPDTPRSLPGVLVAAFQRRKSSNTGGMTLISCDNVPANGAVLRGAVLQMAEAMLPALVPWIEDNVRFPSTMVDRIVPATTEHDLAAVTALTGLQDAAAVVGEPFRQWVIEDTDAVDLPDWSAAGVQFARDVEAYEAIKMRVLNGAQSAIAHMGALMAIETTYDGINNSPLRGFIERMLHKETAVTLPDLPGMEVPDYIRTTIRRLDNSAIRHTNHQIATDGSQKIVQRLIRPLRDRRDMGLSSPCLTRAIAAWAAYLAAGSARYGARWTPSDPLADSVIAMADAAESPVALADAILALRAVFSKDIAGDPGFRQAFAEDLNGWLTNPLKMLG